MREGRGVGLRGEGEDGKETEGGVRWRASGRKGYWKAIKDDCWPPVAR